MEYRNLGKSGLRVSVAGLGTNNFGPRCDEDQAAAVVHRALDVGVNFIDTADIYGSGKSEEYIGKAIKGHRHDVILATKFEKALRKSPLAGGTSRRYLMEAVEDSLRRLDTDYIDLYQIHFWNDTAPIEETLRALDDLVRAGSVRYLGCSNFAAWQMVEAQWVCRSEHYTPLISTQNEYSLLDREIEEEVGPVARRYGMGIVTFFPLARGFLTGKYRPGQPPPPGTRLASPGPRGDQSSMLNDDNFAVLGRLEAFAESHDHTVGELALAWLAAQPGVGSVIAGATKPEQVEQNATAFDWKLSRGDLDELDEALRA